MEGSVGVPPDHGLPGHGARDAATPIVIVGHVDHGKSTLIGRLLHDTGNLPEGRLEAAEQSSARRGLKIEWSFLLDSLQAERDQGVTIDSTRLPFVLDGRPFVIVDAPGHRQFLRNMVTGAADAAAAVLVVDATEGAQEQTRRHAMLLRLMGVRHVIVLLNKADLLDFDAARIAAVSAAVTALLRRLGITPAVTIPASARHGDNVADRSPLTPWHTGPTLTEALAAVPALALLDGPFRLPVQDVYRRDDRRLVVGRIESGRVRVGDTLVIGAQGTTATVAAIEGWPASPVVTRGDLLHAPSDPPLRAARIVARLFWLRQEPLRVGESLKLRLATAEYPVTVVEIRSVLRLDDLTEAASDHVPPEGFAEIVLAAPETLRFDPFEAGGRGGRGVLVDRWQQIVGGAPLLGPAPLTDAERAVFPTDSAVSAADRARKRGHFGGVFWLTGLPGAGKSTVARAAESLLFRQGVDVMVLDGDTVRARLSKDLGFSDADRTEAVRRTAAVARMMADAGLVVLVAMIAPRRADRALAREVIGEAYQEIFVAADVDTCEARDPKGLYAAARAGRITNFTGVSAPYDVPEAPDLRLDTASGPPAVTAGLLAAHVAAAVALPVDAD
jgi:bifunctional enzyme CysN/CysC